MNAIDFEERVWELDGIRIVIRVVERTDVGEYPYQNAAPETQNVTAWLANRITANIGDCEVIVLGGDGEVPHGRTLLRTLRGSYGA